MFVWSDLVFMLGVCGFLCGLLVVELDMVLEYVDLFMFVIVCILIV